MIKLRNQVPNVYTDASRDFQYLSWLTDVVLNSVKHNVDAMYELPNAKADPRITELLAMTLGFKIRRNYDIKQLTALVSVLPCVLKYKGTTDALLMVGRALLLAVGSTALFKVEVTNNRIEITLPDYTIDTTLFMDLLPYILPAGMTCKIVRETIEKETLMPIKVEYSDALYATWQPDLIWDDNKLTTAGLANMFETGISDAPTFANYTYSLDDNNAKLPATLNEGLLDNSMIPALISPIADGVTVETKRDGNGEPET